MANTPTKIADVIQPELFAQYVIDKTTEKSNIMYAGAIENNPTLNQLIVGGGTIFHMPKWNDLSGNSEVLTDQSSLGVDKITSYQELATLMIRGKAWGANELAGALAGDDPMKAIASLVADWWVRDEKHTLMSILNGIFASDSMSDLVLDIHEAGTSAISGAAVLDAKQLMGDASDLLTMIYMHSAVFTELQKQNMIQFIPVAESHIQIPTYLGYRVVMDDSAPRVAKRPATWVATLGGTYATSDTVTLAGVTYTVLATDDTNAKIATALAAAINADATASLTYKATASGATVTVAQKVPGTGAAVTGDKSSSAGTIAVADGQSAIPKDYYTTYLLSRGCIQRGVGVPVSITPVETDRDSLASVDYLINRQAKVLHPKGISWIGAAHISGPTPSDEEFATGTNWNRVAEIKKIGIVKLVHTL